MMGNASRQIQCPACQHLIRFPNPPAGMGFTQVEPESGRTWKTYLQKGEKERMELNLRTEEIR